MKTCTKCGEAKSEAEFGKKADSRDGLQARCKACRKAANKAWYEANRGKAIEYSAAYRAAHPERVCAANAAWRAENPERKREMHKAWYEANRGRVRAAGKAWAEANPEKVLASKVKWKEANPGKHLAQGAAWRKANQERYRAGIIKWNMENPEVVRRYKQNRRARKLAAGGTLSRGLAGRLLVEQKGLCACCGRPLTEWHLDHIVPLAKGGPNTDDNVQLLLPRCNLRKGAKTMDEYMQYLYKKAA